MTRPRDTAALTEPSAGSGMEKIEAMGRQNGPPKWHQLKPTSRNPFRPRVEGPKTGPIFWEQKMVP